MIAGTLRGHMCATFVGRDSDVRLHIGVAWQDVSIGAALGFSRWKSCGQHVGSGVLRGSLVSLKPAVDQRHKEENHAPHHRRHPSQGERHSIVAKITVQETCEEESKRF